VPKTEQKFDNHDIVVIIAAIPENFTTMVPNAPHLVCMAMF
jgi:hypothetical protein